MLRVLFRTIGLLLLACAFAAAIVDGTRSIAADGLVLTTLGQALVTALPTKTPALEAAAGHIHPWLRDPGLRLALLLPLSFVVGALGGMLVYWTRPRRPVIGFSSR